jgi:hypothetical protein
MKLRCQCGHEVQVWGKRAGEAAQCPYCGRSFVIVEHEANRLRVKVEPPRPPASPRQPARTWEDRRGGASSPTDRSNGSRARAVRLGAAPEAPAVRHSWWHYLLGAWAYPLKGNAKYILLTWTVLYVYVVPWFGFLWVAGILMAVAMVGLLALYEFELVRQSAYDADATPSLPNYDDLYELAVRPLGHLLAAVGAAALPLLAVRVTGETRNVPEWWDGLTQGCFLLMALMLPANLLAVATADDWHAVNPRYTLRLIARVPFPYLACCLVCIAFYVGAGRAAAAITEAVGGMFLGTFLGVVAWVYLLSVGAHILGALHHCYRQRIGWLG